MDDQMDDCTTNSDVRLKRDVHQLRRLKAKTTWSDLAADLEKKRDVGLEGTVILDDLHENRLDVEVNAEREIEETPEDPEVGQQQRETEKIPDEPVDLKKAGTEKNKGTASKYRRTEKVPEPKEPVQINDRKAKAPLKARESKKRRTEKVEVEEPVRIIDLKSEGTKKTPDEPETIAEPEETAEKAKKGNPGGKLYSRINYLKQAERKREKEDDEYLSGATEAKSARFEIPPQANTAHEWLQLNQSPWPTVMVQWEQSFEARKENLRKQHHSSNVLQTFPHLLMESGYQLLDIDYKQLGLKTPTGGITKWKDIIEPIGCYIAKIAKDPSAKSIVFTIQNKTLSIDFRLPAVLLGLNTVLIPVKTASGFKPTIATAQDDTLLFCKTSDDAKLALDNLQANWDEQGGSAIPKLVVFGTDYTNVTGNCMVAYKHLRYNLPSIARGIDVLIKLTVVLGLPTSKVSKLVWLFVKKHVYELDCTNTYVCITKLSGYLTSNQPCSSDAVSKTATSGSILPKSC
ncbi:hypothetical protein RP20_CCG007871 [Aedes albopictus]|nr:hypothetical protein RP20_CCG007871 [Aedes albopictus]